MTAWKVTTNRKKIQRHINKILRQMNKNIEQDDLWLGRFYCHQKDIQYQLSEDKSWMYADVRVEFVDRKTNKFVILHFNKEDFMNGGWPIWEAMNSFIIDFVKVWQENPPPSIKNPWDYKKELKK